MRAPSEKSLQTTFGITKKDAKLIRAFAKAEDDPEKLEDLVEKVPATEAYVRSLYSSPYRSGIWRVTVALHVINELVGGYGVEGLGPGRSGDYAPPYEYINMGDTYATTLIYDRDKDELFIGTWGGVVEEEESEWGEYNPRRKGKKLPRLGGDATYQVDYRSPRKGGGWNPWRKWGEYLYEEMANQVGYRVREEGNMVRVVKKPRKNPKAKKRGRKKVSKRNLVSVRRLVAKAMK